MDKINIIYENLCIKKIISVIKGNVSHHPKQIKNQGRHSDAFVYILTGSCRYQFEDKIEFIASEGDVIYLPYHSTYTMLIQSENYEFIFCDFEFVDPSNKQSILWSGQGLTNIDHLFLKLLNRYRSPSQNTYTECMSLLYTIYSILQQNAEQTYLNKKQKDVTTSARNYIDEHFTVPELSISALAEKADISEVYFRKLFKSQYGIPPSKYLNSIRLKNAIHLMKYPFLTLEECALQSGFSSLQYFCRIFKKEFGISPGKYRCDI